ncbi:two-component system sensor histidine kinase [Formosa agariphila KMM 3901]|uniref:Two-component system sensor histidine kinase n=1 Tax=Formosa agariphila (strain DSM 15362 / KCTC 12365 / LMG 23005 / KMM 3901 / M-2Alg 35-1) TaxID=1347342 RepID=T2KJD6_FORAG|nr:DNA-binding response regulator [Formosa agariphila]CDF79002.1 two-component system sensor histidine kinase [Formosa agariphila KMM 3901]
MILKHQVKSNSFLIEIANEVNQQDHYLKSFKHTALNDSFPIINQAIPEDYTLSITQDAKFKAKVLIVEDHDKMLKFITKSLEEHYDIYTATDGKEGIKKAKSILPDVIVSDLRMPVIDGLKLCSVLKADENTAHIPILVLTASIDDDIELEGLKCGANDFVYKPFSVDVLKRRIINLINSNKIVTPNIALANSEVPIQDSNSIFLENVKNTLNKHLDNPDFNVKTFSKEIGMSRMQLHRKIYQCTNLSTSAFIRKQRLYKAKKILKNKQNLLVNEVAYEAGFNTPSYFIKCFKKEYKITPTEYRELELMSIK